MSIYDKNGNELFAVYGADGSELDYAYDASGNEIYRRSTERRIIFEDDFDFFDDTKWTKELGLVRNQDSELQCYRAENVTFESSCLVLTAKKENYAGKEWTSGSISGQLKQAFNKGRFEAKMKFVNAAGAWAAFWMVGNSVWKEYKDAEIPVTHGTWPDCGEIDIIEQLGGMQSLWWTDVGGYTKKYPTIADITEWHVYAWEWTDTYFETFVDGEPYGRWEFANYAPGRLSAYADGKTFYIILNYAIRSGAVALDNTSVYVDWVRVYAPLSD